MKLNVTAQSLSTKASDRREGSESQRAARLEGGEHLNFGVGHAASVDVCLVAQALPIFVGEVGVVFGLAEHFNVVGALDGTAGIAANRGRDLIEHTRFKLHIRNALLDDLLHFAGSVGDEIHNRKTIFKRREQAIKFRSGEHKRHLREVESVFDILMGVMHHVFLLGVEDGEKGGNQLLRQFVRLIEEENAFGALHLRHQLLKELFFVLDAAAVDLVEGLFARCANCAGEFGLADAACAVEHEERENARRLVSVQVEGKLTLDVVLTDDVFECWLHG